MKIFFDMDGTLSEFQTGVGPDVWSAPGYATTLKPSGNMVEAVKKMLDMKCFCDMPLEIYILSAVVSMDFAVKDKITWLRAQGLDIPEENMVFVPYGQSKKAFLENYLLTNMINVNETDLFIDDFTKNLEEFEESFITPVKVLNGINDTNKSWKGARVSAFSSPETIIKSLVGISKVVEMTKGYAA